MNSVSPEMYKRGDIYYTDDESDESSNSHGRPQSRFGQRVYEPEHDTDDHDKSEKKANKYAISSSQYEDNFKENSLDSNVTSHDSERKHIMEGKKSTPSNMKKIVDKQPISDQEPVSNHRNPASASLTTSKLIQKTNMSKELHNACVKEDPKRAKKILDTEDDLDVNQPHGKDKSTALHEAALKGLVEVVGLLCRRGADINARNKFGWTCAHFVAFGGDVDTLKELVRHGADVDAVDDEGCTPLHRAALCGHTALVHEILQQSPASVSVQDHNGSTPLHEAAVKGTPAIAEEILNESKTSINVMDKVGSLPLHEAACNGHSDFVRILLEKSTQGIHVDVKEKNGKTPMAWAMKGGHLEVVKELLRFSEGGANHQDKDGWTVLHHAVSNGKEDIVEYLLKDTDVDVDAKDKSGQTALSVLVRRPNVEGDRGRIASMLLDHGVSDCSPLLEALKDDQMDIASLLSKCMTSQDIVKYAQEKNFTLFVDLVAKVPQMAVKVLNGDIKVGRDSSRDAIGDAESAIDKTHKMSLQFDVSNLQRAAINWQEDQGRDKYARKKIVHPLRAILDSGEPQLIGHPLVKMVLRRHWIRAFCLYLAFLLFYLVYLSIISSYMTSAIVLFGNHQSFCHASANQSNYLLIDVPNLGFSPEFIIIIVIFGIVIDIAKIAVTRLNPKDLSVSVFVSLVTYILAIITLVRLGNCRSHTREQWQVGVACIFLSWFNFIFFLRGLPKLGVYVMMLCRILKTFLIFFIIVILLIFAFALCYFLLLQNHTGFHNLSISTIYSWVMMLGELDFADLFYNNKGFAFHNSALLLIILFLFVMCLAVANLFTALAVVDILEFKNNVDFLFLRFQWGLGICVDIGLPLVSWADMRKVQSVDYYQNKDERWKCYLDDMFFGPLTYGKIRSEALQILDSEKSRDAKYGKNKGSGKESTQNEKMTPIHQETTNDNGAILEDIVAKQDKMLETQHNFKSGLVDISADINAKEQNDKNQEISGKLDNVVSLLENLSDQLHKQRKKVKKVESLLKKGKKHKHDKGDSDGDDQED